LQLFRGFLHLNTITQKEKQLQRLSTFCIFIFDFAIKIYNIAAWLLANLDWRLGTDLHESEISFSTPIQPQGSGKNLKTLL